MQRLLGGARIDDALVETDGRTDLSGELGVIEQVVVCKWLLDEGEPHAVDGLEKRQVVEGVPRVAVDVEGGVGEGAGDDLQHFEVPARGRFQLDARESGVDGLLDVPKEHVVGVLDAEVSAGRHVAGLAAEKPVQGGPGDAALQRPPADLHGRLGEAVALENRQPLV